MTKRTRKFTCPQCGAVAWWAPGSLLAGRPLPEVLNCHKCTGKMLRGSV